jgi:hypothetical protein
VHDSRRRPKIACITDRNIEIFKLLARYCYLPLNDVPRVRWRQPQGAFSPHQCVFEKDESIVSRPHQQQHSSAANHRRLIYELDDKGIADDEDLEEASTDPRSSAWSAGKR